MKFAKKKKQENQRSKLGEIHMISDSSTNSKNMTFNPRSKLSRKSKESLTYKVPNRLNIDSASAQETTRPAININFREILKDVSKEVPKSLKCNICNNLVKAPTKCYQCKALFCKDCLSAVLDKNKKCPKCFKIISKKLLKTAKLDNEFKNTFIKCKYIGCKESVNLLNYEEHLKNCEFKDIKDSLQIDNLVYFNTLPFKEDPYSNSILMEYSVKNAQDEIEINKQTSLIDTDEIIQKKYEDWTNESSNEAENNFKNIFESGKKIEEDILELENRKKEVNDIIKEMQSKIILNKVA